MTLSLPFANLSLLTLLLIAPVNAAEPTLPEWDRLDERTRDTLIAPTRERWNADPEGRQRMLGHAQRWETMTPGERRNARHGIERWKKMSPQQRSDARALYAAMRAMEPQERKALRERWRTMSVQERKAWVDRHPAPPRPDRDH